MAVNDNIEVKDINDNSSELVIYAKQNNLSADSSQHLVSVFEPLLTLAHQWANYAQQFNDLDKSDVTVQKNARDARLSIRAIRLETERLRKVQKEDSLRRGKAIDGMANIIKYLIEPIEADLDSIEKYAELQEHNRLLQLKADRTAELQPFVIDDDFKPENYDLMNMSEESFLRCLESFKMHYEAKQEELRKAQEDKINKEREDALKRQLTERANQLMMAGMTFQDNASLPRGFVYQNIFIDEEHLRTMDGSRFSALVKETSDKIKDLKLEEALKIDEEKNSQKYKDEQLKKLQAENDAKDIEIEKEKMAKRLAEEKERKARESAQEALDRIKQYKIDNGQLPGGAEPIIPADKETLKKTAPSKDNDKVRLVNFHGYLKTLQFPVMSTKAGQAIIIRTQELMGRLQDDLMEQTNKYFK